MHYFQSSLIFLLMLIFSGLSNAQSFSVSSTFVTAVKPADFFVFYNYTQLKNLTGDSLHMRWVKLSTAVNPGAGHGAGSDMGNWVTSILDPSNSYDPADNVDSADFYLGPVASSTDKFIFHLFPNLQAGNLVVQFKVFSVNDPAHAVFVTFDYMATPVVTTVSETNPERQVQLFPNPAASRFNLTNLSQKEYDVWLINAAGQVSDVFSLQRNVTIQRDCSGLLPGNYLLKFQFGESAFVKQLSIVSGR